MLLRHLAPWIVLACAVSSPARAQPPVGPPVVEEPAQIEAPPTEEPPPEPPPTRPVVPEPPVVQARDDEQPPAPAPAPEPERIGEGLRMFIAIQPNMLIGDIDPPTIEGSGTLPTKPSLAGVPDALLGVRIDRFTVAIGLSWSQVSVSSPQPDPCMPANFVDFTLSQTTVGVVPSVRFDVALTDDGRGRLEAGVSVPILISTRSQEMPTFMCPSSSTSTDSTTGIYGVDALFGGRYHLFDALTVGLEFGLSFLVFDPEDLETTTFEEPTTTSLAAYAGVSLAIEVGL
jgi:hypothetical protein